MITTARWRRFGVALVVASGLAVLPALPVSAHVTVSSPDASAGGFGKLVFRVPSESDTANTTSITVALPTDTPFRFVSIGVVPGWTAETTMETLPEPVESSGFTITEAVTSVTWTANDEASALRPHEFAEFALSVGPFPTDVDQLVLPATQTYSDGDVVEWAEPPVEGGEEPERPAPVLELSGSDDVVAVSDASDDGSDTLARVLGGVGLALGAIALGLVLMGRRPKQQTA
jgi:uncharacterized protein YcnI